MAILNVLRCCRDRELGTGACWWLSFSLEETLSSPKPYFIVNLVCVTPYPPAPQSSPGLYHPHRRFFCQVPPLLSLFEFFALTSPPFLKLQHLPHTSDCSCPFLFAPEHLSPLNIQHSSFIKLKIYHLSPPSRTEVL